MMFTLLFILVLSLLCLYNLIKCAPKVFKSDKNLPPGPWGFPILGYMPFFGINPLSRLQKLASVYGDICTIFLGQYRVILLSNHCTIREAFKEEAFSGRPALKMLETRNAGVHMGLVCSEGRVWNEQRKFTLKNLKDLGWQSLEGLVQEELEEMIITFRTSIGTPINLKSKFNLAILNALWRIISGQRYGHDDMKLQQILEKTSADLSETQYTGPLLFLPWLLKIAPRLTRWNKFNDSIKSVHNFLKQIIDEHKKQRASSKGERVKDFIDCYLTEIETTTDPDSSFFGRRGEHSLLVVLLDLLMAGSDTTSETLYWAFLYMVLHENVQRKVQQEIDLVVGNSTPTLENRKMMPYTVATLNEILRKSSLVPMGLFHSTTCDTQLLGFDIPKSTVISANLFHLNNSKSHWKDPEAFRPERFLNENETAVLKFDAFMPFSTGKRVCPGENLAKDQLFLFFVGLLQKFLFVADFSSPRPSEVPNNGVILTAKPYSVILRSRVVGEI